ncbi:MAG: rhodanese-like domain-containing protein [Gimesia sp.]
MKWTCTVAFIALITSISFAVDHTKDSPATIKKNIENKKAVLVDVREQSEWNDGHIKGALFLPLSSLRDGISKAEQKQLPKDKIIYLHCAVGYRAKVAANLLEKYNANVQPISQGYEELLEAGFQKAK